MAETEGGNLSSKDEYGGYVIPLQVLTDTGSQPTGEIHVHRAVDHKKVKGWRATFRGSSCKDRAFGCVKPALQETVRLLLEKIQDRASAEGRARVLEVAGALERGGEDRRPADEHVPIVHQIYGQARDGKEKGSLFQDSEKRWKAYCHKTGARYILWTADQADALVIQWFPWLLDVYRDVRFAFPQRTDIARVCILVKYGGLYSDMDVFPNRDACAMAPFGVAKVPHIIEQRKFLYEMEVIVAERGHPVLLQYLMWMRDRIASTAYGVATDWYHNKNIRYILNTTGPYSFTKFLKLPQTRQILADFSGSQPTLRTWEMNRFDKPVKLSERGSFDFITHRSQSYFTKEFEVRLPMGSGDAALPDFPQVTRPRLTCKTTPSGAEAGPTGGEPTPQTRGAIGAEMTGSQPTSSDSGAIDQRHALPQERPMDKAITTDEEDDDDDDESEHAYRRQIEAEADVAELEKVLAEQAKQLATSQEINNEWVAFFHAHRHAAAATTLMSTMPPSLLRELKSHGDDLAIQVEFATNPNQSKRRRRIPVSPPRTQVTLGMEK